MNAPVAGSIGHDMEVVVQIAFRFRGAEHAENHGVFVRQRVRTPEEFSHAVDEVEAAMWNGTLRSIHELAPRRSYSVELADSHQDDSGDASRVLAAR